MRLIDADALLAEAMADGAYGYVDAKQIANAPSIVIVRCEDCEYWLPCDNQFADFPVDGRCQKNNRQWRTGWSEFCSCGVKKNDG